MIMVASINGKGRGLIATENIRRGSLIVAAPFITAEWSGDHPFQKWGWGNDDHECVITLGKQTLCNDDPNPNCVSVVHADEDLLIAIREIKKGEELTLCYGDFE